jgi:hypothetical protein
MMRFTFTSIVLMALITGCAAIGPISSSEFPQLVARAVPKGDGEIRYYGPGYWYPNARGFTGTRSSLLAPPGDQIPGILVITETAVLFEQWDESVQKFDVIKRLSFAELDEVSLDSYGLNRRLVLRKRDLSFDSFEFGVSFSDAPKTEAAVAFLRTRIRPSDNW